MGCCCEFSRASNVTNDRMQQYKRHYTQAAGHPGALSFEGDVVTKACNIEAIQNYKKIFGEGEERNTSLEKMAPFVPKFISGDESGGYEPGKCHITLENMLFGKENASFADIKLGTSTVTLT